MIEQGQLFKQILSELADLFANEKNRLDRTNLVTYWIYTENIHLIQSWSYSVLTNKQEFIKQEIQRMLENKQIQVSESPWTSPVVLVKKKMANYDFVLTIENLIELPKRMHTHYYR